MARDQISAVVVGEGRRGSWASPSAGGASSLTALADYSGDRVRRSVNLEKAYLQGRFGALPEVDQFAVKQALGIGPDV